MRRGSKDAAASSDDAQPAEPVANAKTPKPTKTAVVSDEGDTGSSAADKKACDTKWGDYKEGSGAHGWKAYFTFMAKCMPQG